MNSREEKLYLLHDDFDISYHRHGVRQSFGNYRYISPNPSSGRIELGYKHFAMALREAKNSTVYRFLVDIPLQAVALSLLMPILLNMINPKMQMMYKPN